MMLAERLPCSESASLVDQARRNAQFLELIEDLMRTPDKDRLKPAYSDKLIRLRALTTEELYGVIVTTYGL